MYTIRCNTNEIAGGYALIYQICDSYAMGCLPLRGDNPLALASGLSYVQVDKHRINILHHLHQCIPCKSRDSSC